MTICVIGMGKIGLPLAVQFATKGHQVIGVDINRDTVEKINIGEVPFPGEALLEEKLREVVALERLTASNSAKESVSKSDYVVVIVPLYVTTDGKPDFEGIDSVCREIAASIQPGCLVSFETTLPVGTTRNRFGKIIEELSGLALGTDFHLVFSPERVLTGRVFADLRKYPKIIGGVSECCAIAGVAFYESVLEFDLRSDLARPNGVWNVDTTETAEMVKLAETTYRDVNIALSNQFAKYAESENIDYSKVREAANSQPFSQLHQPGIAVGGHCIPVYPHFYLSGDPDATLVRESRIVNSGMPEYAVQQILKTYGEIKEEHVLILGASYRSGVKELSYSGVFPLAKSLQSNGAIVEVYDPLFTEEELLSSGLVMFKGDFAKFKIAVIQNDSIEFEQLLLDENKLSNLEFLYDGRNQMQNKKLPRNIRLISLGGKK